MMFLISFGLFCLILFVIIRNRSYVPQCSTFRVGGDGQYYRCNFSVDLKNGYLLKVVNVNNYWFIFNKYLLFDLIQVREGKNIHEIYLAKVFGGVNGIQISVRSKGDLSSSDGDQNFILSLNDLKLWLDRNNLKNKEVVVYLYSNKGMSPKYLFRMIVHKDDVKVY